ncbi:MAG TPA: biotin carboxylase N-terminal domain-containing protein [Candidatus Angelobacter sp.]
MFRRILIANRGEIAVRIMRTCRAMGIETVAVYSDFDRHALHVRLADQAVPIGPAPAKDSYLDIAAIVAAAKKTGAEAIHPGYGFLAENADFAAACENGGIVFIGPRSDVIAAMGSKIEARKLAQEAGVPVVPTAAETDLGFPVLIKASAGGGGRGMRIVRSAAEFQEAFAAAKGEAERAFGDGSLLVEKYVEGARHVEIQIFGDHHGNVMHLNERDCSVQRRHQKIIEESPSPAVTAEVRERMGEAALKLARKLKYSNAGTVEFLLSPNGEFYFIEVNTRIQVEHPVTEMVTGLDLVRMQIEVAQGMPLSALFWATASGAAAKRPEPKGHAIEARLYAEDPANNFLPATGTLHVWEPPTATPPRATPARAGGPGLSGIQGLRVDSGVEQGTEIGVHYDPLLAKIIAHGPDRETAINKLVYALRHCAAQGVETNRQFLIDVLEQDEFRSGRAHTGFTLAPQRRTEHDSVFAAVAKAYIEHAEHARRAILPSIPISYRNVPASIPAIKTEINGLQYPQPRAPALHTPQDPRETPTAAVHTQIFGVAGETVEALVDGVHHHFKVHVNEDQYYIRSGLGQRTVVRLPRYPRRAGAGEHQTANSPMPGQVLRVLVTQGQHVRAGDALVALEAMKMEQTIKATMDGVVGAILVKPGDIVAPGQKLVEIEGEKANEHADRTAASD